MDRTECWHARRADFNHGWLSNDMLQAVGTAINAAEGRVQTADSGRRLSLDVVRGWQEHGHEALEIAGQVVEVMSPKRFFEGPWADWNEETRRWLAPVLHELWLGRWNVLATVAAIERWVSRISLLTRQLELHLAGPTPADVRAPLLRDLHDACSQLSRAFSSLPDRRCVL